SEEEKIGIGSGFVIDEQGLVATNYHVIRGSSRIEATTVDGKKIKVKACRAWDNLGDLAILELDKNAPDLKVQDLKVLPLAQHTTRERASEVIAIGHPQGFQFVTTTGIISAVHTTDELPPGYREQSHAPADYVWLQINAAISGGNSGGPLLNRQGE